LTIVTASTPGPVAAAQETAAQSETGESASANSSAPIANSASTSTVVIDEPQVGTRIDRIPVTKVSPVIEGGAYPAKATVGEAIPIRATVFREGHDAVNASVILTDPDGNERLEPMHPTTPLGFDWWTTDVTLEREGLWTFRVEGWSDPWETWVHNAEIKIPAGIDVSLVCTEGRALFNASAERAETASKLCSRPGMSSSRDRRERTGTKRTLDGYREPSTHLMSGSRPRRRWVSTLYTSHRSIPSARLPGRVRTTP
jgi:starch synthase (maltosyl-transferring)